MEDPQKRSLGWEEAEAFLQAQIGVFLRGESRDRALKILHGFGLPLAWDIINLLTHALRVMEGGKTNFRDPLSAADLLTKMMDELERHLKTCDPIAEEQVQVGAERFLGVHRNFLIGVWNRFGLKPPVRALSLLTSSIEED